MDAIDLNADVGEERGDDAALFGVVTSANVAAGGHAGGGSVLDETIRLASGAGVGIGAHPSYADRAGFGRVSQAHTHDVAAITTLVREQVLVVASACADHGVRLSHVKAHGALYHDVAGDDRLAAAFLAGVAQAAADMGSSGLPVMGMPASALEHVSRRSGVPYLAEAFADRAYQADGSLVPRDREGAVLHDPEVVVERALRIAVESRVVSVDGSVVDVPAVTLCLHGDTPGAVELARRIRDHLEAHGVTIAPFGAPS